MPLRDLPQRYTPLITRLLQARRGGRIAHAYLLTGDNLDLLQALATGWLQAVMCRQLTGDGDACGACRTCRQLGEGHYPYLELRRPESKSRVIKIEHIRDMERRLYLKTEGQMKVGMILSADRMTEEAQNAFLKTLEEPPANTMLLLLSINPNALLPTIRSRCQSIAIMDNRMTYDLEDQALFFVTVAKLQRSAGVNVGIEVAEFLLAAFKQLQAEAATATKEQVEALKSQYQEADPAEKKRLDAEAEGIIASEYLERRETLLSAINSWFSIQYMRANGVQDSSLPNQEILSAFVGISPPPPPPLADALRALRLTEELSRQLRFNVDEALAIQDYCQQVCAKV